MGRQIKGLLYFFITDIRHSLFIFWSILLGTMSVSLIMAYFLNGIGNTKMIFTLSAVIYIYCAIIGFITSKESIPFSIKLGATRKNLFISLGIFFLGLSLVKAVLASTLQMIIELLTKSMGMNTFLFVHPAELLTNSWLTRITIDTAVMFFLLSIMYVLGIVFYKYGLLGGGSIIGIVVIILLLGIAQGWLVDFFIDIYQSLSMAFFYQVLLVGIVLYAVSWVMIRKITIIKAK